MVTRMTADQQMKLIEFREEWIKIGLSTGPADLDALRPIIARLYGLINKKEPVLIRCKSPLVAELVINLLRSIKKRKHLDELLVIDELRNQIKEFMNTTLGVYSTYRQADPKLWELHEELQPMMSGANFLLQAEVGKVLGEIYDSRYHVSSQGEINNDLHVTMSSVLYAVQRASIDLELQEELDDKLRDDVMDVTQEIKDQVDTLIYSQTKPPFYQVSTWFWGSLDAFWIVSYLFTSEHILDLPFEGEAKVALDAMVGLAKHSFWMYPLSGICLVCDRPLFYRFNERDELHCTDGPALEFPDGWSIWAINGISVTEQIVMHPETLTPQEIEGQRDVEVRRIMMERYGVEKFIKSVSASLIHQTVFNERTCQLWRYHQTDDEDVTLLKVTNATAEPDGSFKDYWLRVPPSLTNALKAVAWTFDLSMIEYQQLAVES